jgi:hypothetical protein
LRDPSLVFTEDQLGTILSNYNGLVGCTSPL